MKTRMIDEWQHEIHQVAWILCRCQYGGEIELFRQFHWDSFEDPEYPGATAFRNSLPVLIGIECREVGDGIIAVPVKPLTPDQLEWADMQPFFIGYEYKGG